MTTLIAFILILGAAVVIHEFGHFIVAKLLGIRVETFSVGFGPRIWGRRWGTTDYRLSAIPLGGYVKLGGDESNAPIEGAGESDIPAKERFDLRPRWHKFLVAVAGPVFNVLTALAVPFIAAMWMGVPTQPAPVVNRMEAGGAAEHAGLRPGDRIVSFNEQENPTWERIRGDALLSPDRPIPLVVERNGQRLPLTITPARRTQGAESFGVLEFQPDFGERPVVVAIVQEGSPAAEAGLRPGDRIIAINGEPARNDQYVAQFIQDNRDPLRMTLEREGQQIEIVAGQRRLPDGKLGFGFVPNVTLERVGPVAAAQYAVSFNIEILRLTGKALGQVFTGDRSVRDTLSGPIGIARATSTAVHVGGIEGFFTMFGFLSLNLGIFNLLPIPVLDGGAIFLLFVEGILAWFGIKLSMVLRERIQQAGFAVLLLLMVFVITNDLIKEASIWRGSGDQPAATEQQR